MKKIFILFLVSTTLLSQAQTSYGDYKDAANLCIALQGNSFSSNATADSALEEILNAIGASKRFVIHPCNNIDNAAAITLLGVRYIFYNPNWMSNLQYSGDWANKFILAHEVGHHINNHTIDAALRISGKIANSQDLASSRFEELEADEFAGFVLGRLGASLDQALTAVRNSSNMDDTFSTHPKRDKRINAVKKGFNKSGGRINSSNASLAKGETIESPYSDRSYSGVIYQSRNDLFNNGIYEGYVGINSDKPFGYGVFYGDNGYVYKGEWADGLANGYGKATWPDGAYQEGFFVNDLFTGKGVYFTSSKIKYIGNFVNSSLVGDGKMILEGGQILSGSFYNDFIIKVTITNDEDSKEIGFLDGSNGNGYATFTDFYGTTYTGNWKDGVIVGEGIKKHKGKKTHKKWAQQTGLDHFIPEFILKDLDIQFKDIWDDSIQPDNVGYLVKKYSDGNSVEKGYFKQSFFGPLRAGFIEEKNFNLDLVNWNLDTGYPKFDTSYSIYWDDYRNGYAAFYLNGKLIQKGIYKGGNFVKKEDFDLELMLETYKQF